MDNFFSIIRIPPPSLTIIDVGAASLGQGTDPYNALLSNPHVQVIGFEPDLENCEKRNKTAPNNHTFLPYFIGDGKPGTFYKCLNPFTSSLYEPDAHLLSHFQRMDLPVVETIEVETVRLDDIDLIKDVDYLKMDVQGGELDVILGAKKLIENVTTIHTEVEFIPIYKNQPLFGDIDVALRQQGFLFHNFIDIFSRQFRPSLTNNDPFHSGSQLMFAEGAVFLHDFTGLSTLKPKKLLNLASILHDVYSSFDMVCVVLIEYDRQNGTNYANDYMIHLQ
ncbi:MAG: FkbM family methyltransferase [Desulfotalea sp.]